MSRAPLATTSVSQFVLCGCAREAQCHCQGQTAQTCPGGPVLLLSTKCIVASRLGKLL